MLLFLTVLFVVLVKALTALNEIRMAAYNVFESSVFVPTTDTSLLDTRQLSSSFPTIAECASICLSSSKCRTAVFYMQTYTCITYSEALETSGYLAAASSSNIITISMINAPGNVIRFLSTDQEFESGFHAG